MKRRTEIKLDRAKKFSKRYIFSSKYMVRNTLGVLLAGTVVAGGVLSVKSMSELAERDRLVNAASISGALLDADESGSGLSISPEETALLDDSSIDVLKNHLLEEDSFDFAVGETNNLTQARFDMEGKFLTVEKDANIKTEADDKAEVVGILPEGASGEVVEEGEEWTLVSSGDIEGYVKTEYIVTGEEASLLAEEAAVDIATVIDNNVYVREDAASSSEVLFLANEGDSFVVSGEDQYDWTCVELLNGIEAYIPNYFLEVEEGFRTAVDPDAAGKVNIAIAEYTGVIEKAENNDTAAAKTTDAAVAETDNKTAATETAKNTHSSSQKTEGSKSETTTKDVVKTETKTEAKTEATTEVTTEATIQAATESTASTSDLYLLAAIVYAESGGESYEGQLAVANVVMNRLNNGSFGGSLSDVIYAPYQFTGCQTSAFRNALSTGGSSSCLQAAQEALNGNNNIGGCLYFRPTWNINTSTLSSYTQIGNHIFY